MFLFKLFARNADNQCYSFQQSQEASNCSQLFCNVIRNGPIIGPTHFLAFPHTNCERVFSENSDIDLELVSVLINLINIRVRIFELQHYHV